MKKQDAQRTKRKSPRDKIREHVFLMLGGPVYEFDDEVFALVNRTVDKAIDDLYVTAQEWALSEITQRVKTNKRKKVITLA